MVKVGILPEECSQSLQVGMGTLALSAGSGLSSWLLVV
jgi:tetrahydromethanopterin S-methyltransferase subunit D